MAKLIINDIPELAGEYELDLNFTHRDFRTIKQVAGVRANEVMDAIEAGDLDIVVALAEIALQRAGVQHSVEQLWDAQAGSLVLDFESPEEAAEDPPPSADEPRSDVGSESSGDSTSADTEPFQATLTRVSSGTPQQVSGSARLTSTT